MSLRKLLFKVF